MASVIRICLADDCDSTTRFDHCTQPEHLQSWNGYKTYPVMSQAELRQSIKRLQRLGWATLEGAIGRRQAKIKRLADIQNGDS